MFNVRRKSLTPWVKELRCGWDADVDCSCDSNYTFLTYSE